MRAYQIHEDENYWSGFIYDKDSCSDIVKSFFAGVLTSEMHDRDTRSTRLGMKLKPSSPRMRSTSFDSHLRPRAKASSRDAMIVGG